MSVQAVRQIDISVAEPFQAQVSEGWLARVMECALQAALPAGEAGQVSLLITDDDTVQELNRVYRGLDEVTDVLSFSASHAGHWEGEESQVLAATEDSAFPTFILPPEELPPWGEVIVSYPQICRQAQQRNEPVERELALLIVHGVLHLVGHDHLEPEETSRMQALERAALAEVFQVGTGNQ
ncbi:MAG: rRNA maturation RNase YbeY [Dehalococcoidia bacterium]